MSEGTSRRTTARGLRGRSGRVPVVAASGVFRLLADGSADPAFTGSAASNSPCFHAGFAGDGSGDAVIVGQFTRFQGRTADRVVVVTSGGAIK